MSIYFNPRTHAGCDALGFEILLLFAYFNPRTHAGCDQWNGDRISTRAYFNPRTHAGCDVFFMPRSSCIYISIHAPMQGATAFVES